MIEKLVLMNELLRGQLLSTQSPAANFPDAESLFNDGDDMDIKISITKILSGQTAIEPQAFYQALAGCVNRICADLNSLYLSTILGKGRQAKMKQLKFYRNLSAQMEELIWLMNILTPGDMGQEIIAPISTYLPIRTVLKKKSRCLSNLIPLLDDYSKPVVPIIQGAVNNLLRPGIPVSFRLLQYLEEVLDVINDIVTPVPGNTINYRLHTKLITYNFNHPQYTAYCNGILAEKFGSKEREDKIDKLSWYEMELCRNVSVPGKALYHELPDAQTTLHLHVTEEIKYLKISPAYKQPDNQEKIRFKMSVAESSLFWFGLTAPEVEILDETNFHAVARFAEKHISTIGAEHISRESFRSNAYRYKPETIVSLIGKLLRMVSWLRSK